MIQEIDKCKANIFNLHLNLQNVNIFSKKKETNENVNFLANNLSCVLALY